MTMGQMDLQQSEYFDSNVRFADACNGILFQGEPVIKPEELEECDSVFVQLFDTQKGKRMIADKVKKWKGQHLAILPLENQTYVDYRMVFRVMQEEVMAYEKQHKKAVDNMTLTGEKFENDNEFLSRMKKDWKFIPVIPLILYLGKDMEWDGAVTLYDLLEIDESLQPFVNNYKLNFYDYHKETDFSRFKTENRYLFELLYHNDNQEKVIQILQDAGREDGLDSKAVEVLLNTVDIHIDIETIKEVTNGKERYNMCKAIDDMKNEARNEGYKSGMDEGYKSGINEGIKASIKSLMESLNMSLEQAMDTLKIDEEMRKNLCI